jgi:hypothetical protein
MFGFYSIHLSSTIRFFQYASACSLCSVNQVQRVFNTPRLKRDILVILIIYKFIYVFDLDASMNLFDLHLIQGPDSFLPCTSPGSPQRASNRCATLMLKPSLIISMEVLNHPEPVVVFAFEARFNFVYKLSFAHWNHLVQCIKALITLVLIYHF